MRRRRPSPWRQRKQASRAASPCPTSAGSGKKEALQRRIRAREFVFGIQDGLLSTVGLLSGVSVATQDRRVLVITGVAAGVTGGLSMATGSYLAARTEREIFEREFRDQEQLAASEPYPPPEAVLESLTADRPDPPAALRRGSTPRPRQGMPPRTRPAK